MILDIFAVVPLAGTWIEIEEVVTTITAVESPPSRGAWIEIAMTICDEMKPDVAPFTGGVD